jgi:hypothetical protein
MVCNIYLSLDLWKCKVSGRTNLSYLPKYFGKVERKVRWNKKGGKGIELSSFCSGTQ